jgi:hypothetical protein
MRSLQTVGACFYRLLTSCAILLINVVFLYEAIASDRLRPSELFGLRISPKEDGIMIKLLENIYISIRLKIIGILSVEITWRPKK